MIPELQPIVDQIATERERFARFCRSLSDEGLSRAVPHSTWIVKDFISHLATIDRSVARWFTSIQSGEGGGSSERQGVAWDVDRFNDRAVAERRDRSVDEILAEAAAERSALLAVLDRFTAGQVAASIRFGGDAKRPPSDVTLLRYLQGWALHDAIHTADMLKALPERRDDPVIAGWMDDPSVQIVVERYQRAMR